MFGVCTPDVNSVREFVGGLLLRHTCQLISNAHAITSVLRTTSSGSTFPTGGVSSAGALSGAGVSAGDNEGGSLTVDTSQQVRLATAIYPTVSLMNHSCDPSIIAR